MWYLVLVLVIVQNGFCWKPVAGPASYSHISNHHPVMGTQNTIIEGDGATSIGHTVTYHGKIFPTQSETEPRSILLGDDDHGLNVGDVEGRVLSGPISDYENKFLDGSLGQVCFVGDGDYKPISKKKSYIWYSIRISV